MTQWQLIITNPAAVQHRLIGAESSTSNKRFTIFSTKSGFLLPKKIYLASDTRESIICLVHTSMTSVQYLENQERKGRASCFSRCWLQNSKSILQTKHPTGKFFNTRSIEVWYRCCEIPLISVSPAQKNFPLAGHMCGWIHHIWITYFLKHCFSTMPINANGFFRRCIISIALR